MYFKMVLTPLMQRLLGAIRISALRRVFSVSLLWLLVVPTYASAIEVAVSFRDVGYGTFGGSQLQNIASPKSMLGLSGISKVEFVQNTTSGRFEAIQTGCNSQGNDVAVQVRLTADSTLINGVSPAGTIEFLACVNWLDQPGGKVEGFGFMLPIGNSFTIDYKTTTDVTFTRTATNTGTNFFADLTVSGGNRTYTFNGTAAAGFIGSANFKPASLVTALNQYFADTNPAATSPVIQLVKTAEISVDGNTISYTYVAKNTGNVVLSNVGIVEITSANVATYGGTAFSGTGAAPSFAASIALTDVSPTSDSSDNGSDLIYDTLGVGDSATWTATYTLSGVDKTAGTVTNQAVALAT